VAGFCVVALVATAGWWLWREDVDPAIPPAHALRPGEAAASLQTLQRALRSGDAAEAAALAPPGDPTARAALTAMADNAGALRLRSVSLRYLDQRAPLDAAGRWSATVRVTWRVPEVDRAPARADVVLGLVDLADRVAVTGPASGGRVPVWMAGPADVRRVPGAVVLLRRGAVDQTAAELAGRARMAVRTVRRVLPGWRTPLMVEVPASTPELASALVDPGASYDTVAAVTASVDGSFAPRSPVHVFLNPSVYRDLSAVGAAVVLAHEATHVAVDATSTTAPPWLSEGFADYVALRDTTLPDSRTTAQVARQVRRDGVPRHLPDAAEFDAHGSDLGAAYEGAWLACRLIAREAGEQALVAAYRDVRQGRPVDGALLQHTGFDVASLTARWRAELEQLATGRVPD